MNFFLLAVHLLFFPVLFFLSLTGGCTREPVETDLLVPVHFSSPPPGIVKTNFHTKNIEIKVRGTTGQIRKILTDNLFYLVDLYADLAFDPAGESVRIDPGFYSIPVIDERISMPRGLDIVKVTPDFITVQLDREITKRFSVSAAYRGKPAAGYYALDAVVKPRTVLIKGAESILNAVKGLKTKPVDIEGHFESFKTVVPLELEHLEMSLITPQIQVEVPIKKEIITRNFEKIPVKPRNGLGEVTVFPDEVGITLTGHSNLFKQNNIIDRLQIYVDCEGLGPGLHLRQAMIVLPVGLILTDVQPEKFTVKIEE